MRWFLLRAATLIVMWASIPSRGEEFDLTPVSFGIATKHHVVHMTSEGNYVFACAIANSAFLVFDLSEPASPKLVNELPLSGAPGHVVISGHYAFVAAQSSNFPLPNGALHVIDIADPQQPVLKKTVKLSANPFRLRLAGDLLYIVDASGVRILDIRDPLAPLVLSGVAMTAADIVLTTAYAYVATFSNGIAILDVSDPTMPSLIGQVEHEGKSFRVEIANGVLFASTDGALLTFDLTIEPSAPRQIGNYTRGAFAANMIVRDNYAYVDLSAIPGGIRVLDVADPAKIFMAGQFYLEVPSGGVSALVLIGQSVAFATGGTQSTLNITPLVEASAKWIGSVPYLKASQVLAVGKTNVFLASFGMLTLDATDPQKVYVVSTNDSVRARVMAKSDTRAVTFYGREMQSFLIDSNENFHLNGSTTLAGVPNFNLSDPFSATLNNDFAYVAAGPAGLLIYDLTASDPVAVGAVTNLERVLSVASSSNLVAVVAGRSNVGRPALLDLSNPRVPKIVAEIAEITNAVFVAMQGNLLVVADIGKKIGSFDVTDPRRPSIRGEAFLRGQVKTMSVVEGIAYVAEGLNGFEVFDLLTSDAPRRLGGNSAYAIDDINARGSAIFTATGGVGLSIFNSPVLEGIPAGLKGELKAEGFQLRITGTISGTAIIQRSDDLLIWTDWKGVSSAAAFPVSDAELNSQHQFYRLKL
jgi:hypothetical protein